MPVPPAASSILKKTPHLDQTDQKEKTKAYSPAQSKLVNSAQNSKLYLCSCGCKFCEQQTNTRQASVDFLGFTSVAHSLFVATVHSKFLRNAEHNHLKRELYIGISLPRKMMP